MADKIFTDVNLMGKTYRLGGYEDEAYLQRVATYVNGKWTELRGTSGFLRQKPEMQQVMLALNLADDYFKSQEKVEELNRQLDWNYCGFFLSSYHDPSEISWFEVFYNGAGIDTELTDKQRKEYLEQTGEEEFYTDVTAIQEKDIRNNMRGKEP